MTVTDPVCGTRFESEDAVATVEYGGRIYRFCSEECREAFVEDPEDYVTPEDFGQAE